MALLLLLAGQVSAAGAISTMGEAANAIGGRAKEGDDGALCAEAGEGEVRFCAGRHRGQWQWWLADGEGRSVSMGSFEPGIGVAGFELDRHRNWIAVVSSEEGHPELTVYSFTAWLKQSQPPEPRFVYNPYPGDVFLQGWENNKLPSTLDIAPHSLRFSAGGSGDGHAGEGGMRECRYDPVSGRVSVVAAQAQIKSMGLAR